MANKIISSSNQGLGYIGTFLSQAVNDVNFQSIQSIFSDTSNPNNWTATEIQSAIDLIASTATFLNGTSDVGFIPDAKNFLVGTVYNSLITRLQQLKGEIITIHDPLLKYTLNARVRGATDGKMYKSLANNNQGNIPESSPLNWLLLEPDVTQYFKQQIILSNNATDPDNDIDFSAGNFVFHDNTGFANLNATTKRLDANWAAGINQGGLFVGTKQPNSTYHCFAIYNPTTQESEAGFLLGIANTIPNPTSVLPNGFTKWKRIGSILTDASRNIRQATWNYDGYGRIECIYNTAITDFSQSTGLPVIKTLQSLTIPLGISTNALMILTMYGMTSGTTQEWFLFEPNKGLYNDISIDISDPNGAYLVTKSFCRTNLSAQIQHYFNVANPGNPHIIKTIGYIDYIL